MLNHLLKAKFTYNERPILMEFPDIAHDQNDN